MSVASRFYQLCRKSNVQVTPKSALEFSQLATWGLSGTLYANFAIQLGIGVYYPIGRNFAVWNVQRLRFVDETTAWKLIWANIKCCKENDRYFSFSNVLDRRVQGLCELCNILFDKNIVNEDTWLDMLKVIKANKPIGCSFMFERNREGFEKRVQFVYNRICKLDPSFEGVQS